MNSEPSSARNGRNVTAQGSALGKQQENDQALKGRNTGTGVMPPFRGSTMTPLFPGRPPSSDFGATGCPGLVYPGPLGLKLAPAELAPHFNPSTTL